MCRVVKATHMGYPRRGVGRIGPTPRDPESGGNRERGVDFVVAGFGLGAVLMLVGFAVRDVGPLRNRSRQDDAVSAWQWSALCRRVGAMIVTGGFAVCLVTLLLLVVDVSDDTGAVLVAMVSAAAVIGSGVGSVLTIRRFAEEQAAWSYRRTGRVARRVAEPEYETDEVPEAREETAGVAAEDVREERPEAVVGPVLEEVPGEPSYGRMFASSILADVGTEAAAQNGSGFRSSVLADLSKSGGEGSDRGYSSSVLADLAEDGEPEAMGDAVYGPPVPEETATVDADDAGSGDAEKADQEQGAPGGGEPQAVAEEPGERGDEESKKEEAVDVVGSPRMTQ